MNDRARFIRSLVALALFALGLHAARARAEVLQAPIFGRPIALGEARVACGTTKGGWIVDATGRSVRPPRSKDAVGETVEVKVAPVVAACESSEQTVTLLATERFPAFDPGSVVFAPDEGRLDVRGTKLSGVVMAWKSGSASGSDTCRSASNENGIESCTFALGRGASGDPSAVTFTYVPGGGRVGAGVTTYDSEGRKSPPEDRSLIAARVELSRMLAPDASIDLASGQGEVPLVHPEAVTSANCGPLQCDMINGRLIARGASSLVHSVDIELRLLPHVVFMRGDQQDTRPRLKLLVLHCPMAIVSGAPFRGNDQANVVVQLEGGCARDLSALRFVSGSMPLKVLRTAQDGPLSYVLLRLGRIADDEISVTALRGEQDGIALAVAHSETRDAPAPRAALELPGFPNIDFIPNNRPARVYVTGGAESDRFALLPIEGVYTAVPSPKGTMQVQGDRNAAGLTSLRFGMRATGLPPALADANLAVVTDPLQRNIREANLPVPISVWVERKTPLIEMLCGKGKDQKRVVPGVTAKLDFGLRDSCRLVFHRDQLPPDYGTQKIRLEMDVYRPDGSARGDAHVDEVLTLRSGKEPRQAWVQGVTGHFDRVVVRVAHEADEAHYVGASEIRTGAPAAQWSAILGTGVARLYGTTTIPTGLYRLSDNEHSGVLSLNFGVLSRLTWLDSEGHEGFLGLEAGVLVMGLANSESNTGESLTQVGGVVGLGLSVPIANPSMTTQASINLHAWYEFDITSSGDSDAGRHAIIFGPSISIGNVGLDF